MVSGDERFVEEDRVVFPNILRRVNQIQIHAAIDDTHTACFKLYFSHDKDGLDADLESDPVDYYVQETDELKEKAGGHPDVRYQMKVLGHQDIMAIETQGPLAPRPSWHLATADRGIVMYERMLLREMDQVEAGHDPIAVLREPGDVVETAYEHFRQNWNERLAQVYPAGVQQYAKPGSQRQERVGAPA